MKQINKIVILSDENTTLIGRRFGKLAKKLLQQRKIEVYGLTLNICLLYTSDAADE